MKIPVDLTLSVEDIRHLKHTQLSLLTGIDPSNFAAWSNQRRISERNLERIATHLGISKPDLLQGLELCRQDTAIARACQIKADQLIAFLQLSQKSA